MEEHIVKIINAEMVTHNVRRFTIEKPSNYKFTPGQATEISINKPKLKDERRPFTFTSLAKWPALEFTIKIYNDHNGVTNALGNLSPGDEIILHDVWGAIRYKGSGVFIAGGAGVTPFIAILRDLFDRGEIEGNRLIFSNRTAADIILKKEFEMMLGDNFFNTLTREQNTEFNFGRIDKEFLEKQVINFHKNFYVCGPDKFVKDILQNLENLGARPESLVFEE